MKMFYSTREKYPASRVDLQDLFSQRVCRQLDIQLDWHMQSMEGLAKCEEVQDAAGETVFLGRSSVRKGWLKKLQNQWFSFVHDCKTWIYIRRNTYDIVQIRDKFWVALVALAAMRGRGGVFCYWMSFPYAEADLYRIRVEKDEYSWFYRLFYGFRGGLTHALLYKIILPRADFIFVQSQRMLEDVAKQGISRNKMIPVPMGIAWERLQDLPPAKDLALPKKARVAVYMGTMVKVRRLDFILEAFVDVLTQEESAILLMVGGEPSDVQRLQNIAEKLGISHSVRFTGLVDIREAWAYVLAADICLSPFRPSPILDSTSPTKVVEYLALGKPVVVNDQPDQSQVIAESKAGIVTQYSPQSFAQGILELFEHPEQWQSMGESGQAYVKQARNYDTISENVANIYLELNKRSEDIT